jgi:putative transposase
MRYLAPRKGHQDCTLARRRVKNRFCRTQRTTLLARRSESDDVLERLTDLFIRHGIPEHLRSDNGSGFTAKMVRDWLSRLDVRAL